MTTAELLTELRASRTDLARIVEGNKFPRLVVQAQSVRAWEQREPSLWARVREWLEAQSISVREV